MSLQASQMGMRYISRAALDYWLHKLDSFTKTTAGAVTVAPTSIDGDEDKEEEVDDEVTEEDTVAAITVAPADSDGYSDSDEGEEEEEDVDE